MKKLFFMAALGVAGLMSANSNIVIENCSTESNKYISQLGDWGCYGTLYIYDDWAGEYVAIKSFGICCYDTAEQACAAVENELLLVASNY